MRGREDVEEHMPKLMRGEQLREETGVQTSL